MTVSVISEATSADATSGATSIAAPSVTCQAGDCLHIIVCHGLTDAVNMAATPLTNTNTGLTYSAALDNVNDAADNQRLVHYIANNVPAQSTVITANFNGSATYRAIKVKLIRGASAYDSVAGAHAGQLQATPGTGANAVTSGNTPTLTSQPALISSVSVATGAARTTATGTGFTSDQTTAWQFGTGVNMSASESKRVTATTALAATYTAASNDPQITVAAVFLESATENSASGTPAAQSATASGTAERTLTSSGAPAAQSSSTAGTAEREVPAIGTGDDLIAQSATVSGTATVGDEITGSGAPSAQSAAVAGTAERSVTASGAVNAQAGATAGTAERVLTSSGTLSAQSATVEGSAQASSDIVANGSPTAQSASAEGAAERIVVGSGVSEAQEAIVSGAAERIVSSTGSPAAQSSTVDGSGLVGSVEVPDVVGQTQANGTTTLETALFVVSVETAYSPTIPAGTIISQDPTGGSFAASGSTVTITVSLGAEPISDQPTGGGWAFLNSYQIELQRRKRRKKELEELEQEVERIEDKLDHDIAVLLHDQEVKDERQKDLKRLHDLAKAEQDLKAAQELGDRVAIAYARALRQGNYSALEALDRELKRAIEEEEFLLEAARIYFD